MHIREIIGPNFFSNSQHAYMKDRSTEFALHSLVAVVEKSLEFKEYSLDVFLDVAGAFNNVSIEAIIESLLETGINNVAFLWIGSLLRCRKIKAEWNDSMAIKRVVRWTPQGGVLSPFLWLLVINRMLKMFDGKASKLIAYADDVAIIVTEMPVNAQLNYEQHIARYFGMGTKYRSGYQC